MEKMSGQLDMASESEGDITFDELQTRIQNLRKQYGENPEDPELGDYASSDLLGIKFELLTKDDVLAWNTVHKWMRIFREQGAEALPPSAEMFSFLNDYTERVEHEYQNRGVLVPEGRGRFVEYIRTLPTTAVGKRQLYEMHNP